MKVLRLLFVLVLTYGTAANAAVIFSNGGIGSNSFVSDPDFPLFAADDFTLASGASTITDIQWTGLYFSSNTPQAVDDFTIQIYADIAGAPDAGAPLHSLLIGNPGRTDTGVDATGSDIYFYSVSVAPIVLVPGTTYWLSISNDTTGDADDNWFWGMDDAVGNSFIRPTAADPWSPINNRHDFTLIGPLADVPEPPTLALLLAATIAVVGFRRNRG